MKKRKSRTPTNPKIRNAALKTATSWLTRFSPLKTRPNITASPKSPNGHPFVY